MKEERAANATEPPTPRRLREARRRGQVGRSRDLTGIAAVAGGVAALAVAAAAIFGLLVGLMRSGLGAAFHAGTRPDRALAAALAVGARAALPVALAALAAAVIAGIAQTGGLFARSRQPVAPFDSLRRIAGSAGWELARGSLVLGGAAIVLILFAQAHGRDVLVMSRVDPFAALSMVGALAMGLAWRLIGVLFGVALLDFLWQRYAVRRALRMTRREALRERREEEGDPRRRAEQRRLHGELLRRLVADGPLRADRVIAGDGAAVALVWDRMTMRAPRVVAGGVGLSGARVLDLARQAGVPMIFDVATARALSLLAPDDEVPEPLEEAVARVYAGRTER